MYKVFVSSRLCSTKSEAITEDGDEYEVIMLCWVNTEFFLVEHKADRPIL
jgi:hypothetical protein